MYYWHHFYSIAVLSQCNARRIRIFAPWGKRAIVRCYPAQPPPSPLCVMFSCFYATGCKTYSFTADGYDIFNVRTHLGASRSLLARTGVRHKHVCTRVDSEWQKKKSPPCPARGSNPGSSHFNFDALTNVPWSPYFIFTEGNIGYCFTLYRIAICYIVLCCFVLYCIVFYCDIVLYCTALNCIVVLQLFALHCIVLPCMVRFCVVWYDIRWYGMVRYGMVWYGMVW